MCKDGQISIRLLEEADIPAALRLKNLARWNQTESDWLRLLSFEPRGCFVACAEEMVVATTTTTRYGPELAWIGMVLVDPEFRRRGIASRLMKAALEYLETAGTRTVKLDATPEGQAVYEALGFEKELLIERWEGVALKPASAQEEGCRYLDEESLSELLSLDRSAFGADRERVLRALMEASTVAPLISVSDGVHLDGYVMARPGAAAYYIGPLVAVNERAAALLLDAMLAQLSGEKVYVDFRAGFPEGDGLLARHGFTRQRELVRMQRGEKSVAGTSALVFAIAGPEIG